MTKRPLENCLLLSSLPGAPSLLPAPPHLVAACRLWKVRLGKLTNRRVSSSPEAWAFLLRSEAWTAARKAFEGCFLGPAPVGGVRACSLSPALGNPTQPLKPSPGLPPA